MSDFKAKAQAIWTARKWWIIAIVAAFIIGGMSAKAHAAFPVDATLIWTDPDSYTDGTPLNPDLDLVQYEAVCTKSGAEVFRQSWAKEVGVTSKAFPGAFDGAGTYICTLRTQATNGLWSDPSNEASKKVTGNPNAPVIIEFDAARQ